MILLPDGALERLQAGCQRAIGDRCNALDINSWEVSSTQSGHQIDIRVVNLLQVAVRAVFG